MDEGEPIPGRNARRGEDGRRERNRGPCGRSRLGRGRPPEGIEVSRERIRDRLPARLGCLIRRKAKVRERRKPVLVKGGEVRGGKVFHAFAAGEGGLLKGVL